MIVNIEMLFQQYWCRWTSLSITPANLLAIGAATGRVKTD
jgi:hypothetical protein